MQWEREKRERDRCIINTYYSFLLAGRKIWVLVFVNEKVTGILRRKHLCARLYVYIYIDVYINKYLGRSSKIYPRHNFSNFTFCYLSYENTQKLLIFLMSYLFLCKCSIAVFFSSTSCSKQFTHANESSHITKDVASKNYSNSW